MRILSDTCQAVFVHFDEGAGARLARTGNYTAKSGCIDTKMMHGEDRTFHPQQGPFNFLEVLAVVPSLGKRLHCLSENGKEYSHEKTPVNTTV